MKLTLLPILTLSISLNAYSQPENKERNNQMLIQNTVKNQPSNFYERKGEGWHWYQDHDEEVYEYLNVPDHENKNGRSQTPYQKLDFEKRNIRLPSGAYKTPAITEPTDGL